MSDRYNIFLKDTTCASVDLAKKSNSQRLVADLSAAKKVTTELPLARSVDDSREKKISKKGRRSLSKELSPGSRISARSGDRVGKKNERTPERIYRERYIYIKERSARGRSHHSMPLQK